MTTILKYNYPLNLSRNYVFNLDETQTWIRIYVMTMFLLLFVLYRFPVQTHALSRDPCTSRLTIDYPPTLDRLWLLCYGNFYGMVPQRISVR